MKKEIKVKKEKSVFEALSTSCFTVASEEKNSSTAIGIGSTALVVGLLIVFIYILKRNFYCNMQDTIDCIYVLFYMHLCLQFSDITKI
jgi:hypothetical protein